MLMIVAALIISLTEFVLLKTAEMKITYLRNACKNLGRERWR